MDERGKTESKRERGRERDVARHRGGELPEDVPRMLVDEGEADNKSSKSHCTLQTVPCFRLIERSAKFLFQRACATCCLFRKIT